jgi:uncharacterized protein YeaO (DUF488 family)
MIALKRAYDKPASKDGIRVLVERLWPRGVTKEAARLDHWLRDLAPSATLRKWFHARPTMWRQFRDLYLKELRAPAALAQLEQLYELAAAPRPVTLIFASRDTEHNSAVVLKELLEGMRKPPTSSGPEKAAAVPMRARARR